MIKIFTPLKNGQPLMPSVMRGVIDNGCCLVPITSRSDSSEHCDRKNMADNWLEAFRVCDQEIFIGMDSDTVLPVEIIDEIINDTAKNDLVVYCRLDKDGHDLFAFDKTLLGEHPFIFKDQSICPVCDWINSVKKDKKVLKKPTAITQAVRT